MKQIIEPHTFTGMQRDTAVSKHPFNFLYDAKNIRLTAREDDSLLSVTNEKGTTDLELSITGTYLGHCLLNKYLVIFSVASSVASSTSYIYRVDLSNTPSMVLLYSGNLGFGPPIEAIASYENENVQKVYWTDGKNQPRVINIAGEFTGNFDPVYFNLNDWNDSSFDFVPELRLEENVTIIKQFNTLGFFPSGVIQYAFTYYNKYGQESNIFYVSPLLYISPKDRGGAPDEKVANSFYIEVDKLDTKFDYLRIYSIQRTSLNGTPICKRVQDIEIKPLRPVGEEKKATFTDLGNVGDIVDPKELLYKGGQSVTAGTIEQKDNTLFLGDITLTRPSLKKVEREIGSTIKAGCSIEDLSSTRGIDLDVVDPNASASYLYNNQMSNHDSAPCCGFKRWEKYRLGVQFQYKDGSWSEPVHIKDGTVTGKWDCKKESDNAYERLTIPTITGKIDGTLVQKLYNKGYRKARAVVVFPEGERKIPYQGVVCPTLYTNQDRKTKKSLVAQSSWFFRPTASTEYTVSEPSKPRVVSPRSEGVLAYTKRRQTYNPTYDEGDTEHISPGTNISEVEIQGFFGADYRFRNDRNILSFHSPDIEFGDNFLIPNVSVKCQKVGVVDFDATYSSIKIQLETPPISNMGSGAVEYAMQSEGPFGICAGMFYEDFIADDNHDTIEPYEVQHSPYRWMVYPWHKSGSLNNDINRPVSMGTRTAILKKKVLSNLRYTTTTFDDTPSLDVGLVSPELFSSDTLSLVKLSGLPSGTGDDYEDASKSYMGNIDTSLLPTKPSALFFGFDGITLEEYEEETSFNPTGLYKVYSDKETDTATTYTYGIWKWNTNVSEWEKITGNVGNEYNELAYSKEPVRMKYKSSPHLVFYRAADLSPAGAGLYRLDIIELCRTADPTFGGTSSDALRANIWIPCGEPKPLPNATEDVLFYYSYGDTYFQRYDCLKTYPFTQEDTNQIVEIGSFMLETHMNIDGRYDRNRGQLDNTMMTPQNFNLINPVYSQKDNFFTYRILDEDFYTSNRFPNQITWTEEKQAGADVDAWTNVTLASTYDMDGSKGSIVSLNAWKDHIFCFQDKSVSNILFNSRVQIPTSDGVPIEISNSYKVDGYRYLSDGVGCRNKFTIKETPAGIYFIDSISNNLYSIGDGIQNISVTHNMSSWFKDNTVDRAVYDGVNHDLYLINSETALCFSEVLGQFTSFMDYGDISLMESYDRTIVSLKNTSLYKMFSGEYNYFFTTQKPWYISFISNGTNNNTAGLDKMFTNLEYRMDMFDNENYSPNDSFDYIQVSDEYQDTGECTLNSLASPTVPNKNLQKKFKIWRIQIPRDKTNKLDRIRNPWCNITLGVKQPGSKKAILHDLVVQYYI